MDWNTFYNTVIAPVRAFIGQMIDWIDRYLIPWTNQPVEEIPWEER